MTSQQSLTLASRPVGPIGHGLMGLTWVETPPPVSQAFAAMRQSLSMGANFWNGGELYGTQERNSLHLLNEYFTKYPEDAQKVVISIKGGVSTGQFKIDGSEKNIRRSVDECVSVLAGKKVVDIFECARVDQEVPIEDQMRTLKACMDEGKIRAVGLSECSADTIRRASKIVPVAAVEVELSLFTRDILYNGIAETCAELNIPVVPFSVLGRGILTDKPIRSNAEIPDGDHRKHMPRFQDDALEANYNIVQEVRKLADKKGCKLSQIALAWVRALSGSTLPDGKTKMPTFIPIAGASSEERVKENMALGIELNEAEMKEIWEVLDKHTVVGGRYPENILKMSEY